MKKALLVLVLLLFLCGCNKEEDNFDEVELSLDAGNNSLQCFSEENDITYRMWIIQDPKTYNLLRSSLTVYGHEIMYDESGNKLEIDINEKYCNDFDKEKYTECYATLDEDSSNYRVKYLHIIDDLNEDSIDQKKTILPDLKEILEEQNYKCTIFMISE